MAWLDDSSTTLGNFVGEIGGAALPACVLVAGEGLPVLNMGALREPGDGICRGLRISAGVGAENCKLGKPRRDFFLRSEESGSLGSEEGSNHRAVGVGGSDTG